MRVLVSRLRASISRVVSRTRGGEVIEVTRRHQPIVRILGIPSDAESGLRRLLATGDLVWKGGKPKLASPLALVTRDENLSKLVLDDRE